jgi:hypothetical protein
LEKLEHLVSWKIHLILPIDVPTSIFSMIKGIFTKNPGLDSTYENNPVNLLDQMFSQYAIDSLADDIKTQFKNIL